MCDNLDCPSKNSEVSMDPYRARPRCDYNLPASLLGPEDILATVTIV